MTLAENKATLKDKLQQRLTNLIGERTLPRVMKQKILTK
jgi:hypothetical protein